MISRLGRSHFAFLPAVLSLLLGGCGGATPAPSDASASDKPASDQPADSGDQAPTKTEAPQNQGVPAPSDVAAAPAGSQCTPSGLCIRTIVTPPASGATPGPDDRVDVHYTGWTKNGTMFDSSIARGESITFPVAAVIEGWTEALQLMQEGGTYRIWIPAALAYGENPQHPQAPAGQLTFDVELIRVIPATPAPAVPEDVAAAPANATCTKSGLCYVVLQPGKSPSRRPGPEDRVTVHYTGWTKAGEQFDTSIERGRPATFQLNKVLKGWTEMLQLMDEGSKVLVWIPPALAYGEKPEREGAPAGQLTFEIELLSFETQSAR